MFRLGADVTEPIHDDSAAIRQAIAQRRLRVFTTLAGAGAGMYVAFATEHGLVYVGVVAGMLGFYKMFSLLMALGRHWGAKEYEIVHHHPPTHLDD